MVVQRKKEKGKEKRDGGREAGTRGSWVLNDQLEEEESEGKACFSFYSSVASSLSFLSLSRSDDEKSHSGYSVSKKAK